MIRKSIQVPVIGLGALLLSLGSSTSAQAVSIYLGNGWRPSQVGRSFTYTADGIDVRATAFDARGSSKAKVYKGAWGLGVIRGPYDSTQLDGKGVGESLRLRFSSAIRLVSATFSTVDRNDDASVTLNGSQLFAGKLPKNYWGIGKVSFSGSAVGSVADFSIKGRNDNYYLKAIEVEKVPEPMTILGTGLALGLGAVLERKRSKRTSL